MCPPIVEPCMCDRKLISGFQISFEYLEIVGNLIISQIN